MHAGGKCLGKVYIAKLQSAPATCAGFKRVRWCWHLVENASCNDTLLVAGGWVYQSGSSGGSFSWRKISGAV